jgi:hypothetical protein
MDQGAIALARKAQIKLTWTGHRERSDVLSPHFGILTHEQELSLTDSQQQHPRGKDREGNACLQSAWMVERLLRLVVWIPAVVSASIVVEVSSYIIFHAHAPVDCDQQWGYYILYRCTYNIASCTILWKFSHWEWLHWSRPCPPILWSLIS